jgi:hypothetical protein
MTQGKKGSARATTAQVASNPAFWITQKTAQRPIEELAAIHSQRRLRGGFGEGRISLWNMSIVLPRDRERSLV